MDDATIKIAMGAVKQLQEDPGLIHAPELKFFKDYIESLGGTVPKVEPKKEDHGHGHGHGHSGHEGSAGHAGHGGDSGHKHDDGCCGGHGGKDEGHGHGHAKAEGHGHGHAAADEPKKPEDSEEPEEPVEPEVPADPESDDPDRMSEDAEPFPEKSPGNELELTDDQMDKQGELKQAATEALEDGDKQKFLDKFTEAIKIGNVSAMMYAKRADVLLKMKKPCACISDCDAALVINPDSAKAYRIRGKAKRFIGKWEEAHQDISTAQKLDFDDDTCDLQAMLNKKHKKMQDRMVLVRAREERVKVADIKRRKAKAKKEYDEFDKKRAAEAGMGGMGGMGGMPGGMPGGMGGMPGGMPEGFDPSMFASMFGGKGGGGGGKGGMPGGIDPSMFASMFGGKGGGDGGMPGGIDPSMFAGMMGGKGGGKAAPEPEESSAGPTIEEVID